MVINKHGSFYIRNGWPTKIIDAINENEMIFSPREELLAVDNTGVGRVMVRALRYWAKATGLVEEEVVQQGIACHPTPLFRLLRQNDYYFLNNASLWLLHRNLARDDENATAWYWAFNEFTNNFSKDEFVNSFYSYLISAGGKYKKAAIEKEFLCFKNTYVNDSRLDLSKIIEEDTIPFFAPLNLISYKGSGRYEKTKIRLKDIPGEVLYYCILQDNEEFLRDHRQINIDKLLEEKKQVGKYINLSYSSLLELLQIIENKGFIQLHNNFGNRYIEILQGDSDVVLQDFFNDLER